MAKTPYHKWTDGETALARQLLQRCASDAEFRRVLGHTREAAVGRLTRLELKVDRGAVIPERVHIPPEVVAEAVRRSSAPVTITGFVMGDPPIGYSALDRRGNQAMQVR